MPRTRRPALLSAEPSPARPMSGGPDVATAGPSLPGAWRIAAFVLVYAVLYGLYGLGAGTWLQQLTIDHATVGTAARIIDLFDPELGVRADGSRLRAPGGGLNVLNGCEGVDVWLLLVAGLLAAPLRWRARLLGLAAGTTVVFALNQARVIGLLYAFRHDRSLFELLHGVVGPLVMVACVAVFFSWWLLREAPPPVSRSGVAEVGR